MFQQKATETVTLTRNQLQAILELITQIGGISGSESRHELKNNYKNDNRITFNENQSTSVDNYWEPDKEELMTRSEWISKSDSEQNSPLLMINDSQVPNRLLSATLSDISRIDSELRTESAMANESSTESKYRRYARINDSEFDWNELQRKKMKALEYSKALNLQYEEKKRQRLDEQKRVRDEEKMLEKRIEEQRIQMKRDFETEQKLLEEKRLLAEKKREAVVEAIERTPIIKKRSFLVDRNSGSESAPVIAVAAVMPQSRTREMSAQTDRQSDSAQACETGTQTDVQLLLYLLDDMKLVSKEKLKPKFKSTENLSTDSTSSVNSQAPKIRRRTKENNEIKGDQNKDKVVAKRSVWVKNKQIKSYIKTNDKTSVRKLRETDNKDIEANGDSIKPRQRVNSGFDSQMNDPGKIDKSKVSVNKLSRSSLTLSASAVNISELNSNKRVMSSIDTKSKLNFLPEIRPHSRKKWFSHQTFDPNFLS